MKGVVQLSRRSENEGSLAGQDSRPGTIRRHSGARQRRGRKGEGDEHSNANPHRTPQRRRRNARPKARVDPARIQLRRDGLKRRARCSLWYNRRSTSIWDRGRPVDWRTYDFRPERGESDRRSPAISPDRVSRASHPDGLLELVNACRNSWHRGLPDLRRLFGFRASSGERQ